MRWNRGVEKVGKDMGGNHDKILCRGIGAGCKITVRGVVEIRGRRKAQTYRRGGRTPVGLRGVEGEESDENSSAWLIRRGESIETAFSGGEY